MGFQVFILQWSFLSLIGGGLGLAIGLLIYRSRRFTELGLYALRLGLWLPFVIMWALPIWPPAERHWFIAVLISWAVSLVGVMFGSCYSYLGTSLALQSEHARPISWSGAIRYALLFTLVSQLWMKPIGWEWYFLGNRLTVFHVAIVTLVAVCVLLLDRWLGFSFEQAARARTGAIVREMEDRSWTSRIGIAFLTAICLIMWVILSDRGLYPVLSSPIAILRAFYSLLWESKIVAGINTTIWIHIITSLLEVVSGLALSGAAALMVSRCLGVDRSYNVHFVFVITLMNVLPIFLVPFVAHFGGVYFQLQTILGIVSISVYPILQVLWGLRDRPLPFRVLLALDEALPFAFIAMLFWEAVSATVGLQFVMTAATAVNKVDVAIAVAFLTIVLLLLMSFTFRVLARKFHQPV